MKSLVRRLCESFSLSVPPEALSDHHPLSASAASARDDDDAASAAAAPSSSSQNGGGGGATGKQKHTGDCYIPIMSST